MCLPPMKRSIAFEKRAACIITWKNEGDDIMFESQDAKCAKICRPFQRPSTGFRLHSSASLHGGKVFSFQEACQNFQSFNFFFFLVVVLILIYLFLIFMYKKHNFLSNSKISFQILRLPRRELSKFPIFPLSAWSFWGGYCQHCERNCFSIMEQSFCV